MPRNIEAYSYGCLMAMLPDSVAQRVRDFASLIPDEDIYDDGSGEHGREDLPHVTVKYGFHTEDGEEVKTGLEGRYAAHATLLGMTAFENDKFTVLKMDVKSDDLHKFNEDVSRNFEVTDSFPVYHPHVTIAYLSKDCDWRKYACDLFSGTEITFEELLYSSATDVETVIPLFEVKEARIAAKVANQWIEKMDMTSQFPDQKTEIQVKIQLAFEGDDLSAEHRAQQAFINSLPQLGARKVIVVGGEVNKEGLGVS